MGLPLHFIKNNATGAWMGNPMAGLEEGDFEDAHAFGSLGEALTVHEFLTRRGRRGAKRLIGLVCRHAPDDFEIVSLTLGEPGGGEAHGQMVESPEDEFEDEDFEEDDVEDRAPRRAWPSHWPNIWTSTTRSPKKKAA